MRIGGNMLNNIKKLRAGFLVLDDKYQILQCIVFVLLIYGYVSNEVSRWGFFTMSLLECLLASVLRYKLYKIKSYEIPKEE